jgi:hypothetical protein
LAGIVINGSANGLAIQNNYAIFLKANLLFLSQLKFVERIFQHIARRPEIVLADLARQSDFEDRQ